VFKGQYSRTVNICVHGTISKDSQYAFVCLFICCLFVCGLFVVGVYH
jgi:hypothetical protein